MLVITIIVIIILAVAAILTLANNNPLENARRAVEANDEATIKEEAILLYADWYMKKNIDGEDVGDAEIYIKSKLKGNYSNELKNRLTVTNEGVITIGSKEESENPVIPNGFEYLTGTVETGYVIKNSTDRNEFVWVPVEEGTFVRYSFTDTELDTTTYVEPYSTTDYTEEVTEYNAIVSSVNTYGGFYIARYEASKNATTNKAQSISNQTPCNNIAWGASMIDVTGGAVEAARAVYPAKDATTEGDPVSTLPYGVEWDATVRFILTKYPEDILTDSQDY